MLHTRDTPKTNDSEFLKIKAYKLYQTHKSNKKSQILILESSKVKFSPKMIKHKNEDFLSAKSHN